MENDTGITSTVLVDNWLLELASAAISENAGSFSRKCPDEIAMGHQEVYPKNALIRDQILALMQVLDLIVLYDKIVYDKIFEYVWSKSGLLVPLVKVLHSVELTDDAKETLDEQTGIHYLDDLPEYYIRNAVPSYPEWMDEQYNRITQRGAFYYLSLSEVLGVDYWPCPARAKFIKEQMMDSTNTGFIYQFNSSVNRKASALVASVLENLVGEVQAPFFPGFGSSILSACDTRLDILPVALEHRNTSTAKAFRLWLKEMELAFEEGDVIRISKGLKDVNESLAWVSKELGIDETKENGVALQIGITPALKIEGSVIKEAVSWFRRKPLHITFFREHFDRALHSADLVSNAKRLYPEFSGISLR